MNGPGIIATDPKKTGFWHAVDPCSIYENCKSSGYKKPLASTTNQGLDQDAYSVSIFTGKRAQNVQQAGEQIVYGNIQGNRCHNVVGLTTMHHFTGLVQDQA